MLQAMFSTLALLMALAPLIPAQTNGQACESVIRIVEQIKRADYEGDRLALKRLHGELKLLPDSRMLAPRVILARLRPLAPGNQRL
jgi:hypothetical protein